MSTSPNNHFPELSLPGAFGDYWASNRQSLLLDLGERSQGGSGSGSAQSRKRTPNVNSADAGACTTGASASGSCRGSSSSSINTTSTILQRPPPPIRALSQSAVTPDNAAAIAVPSSPALSDSMLDGDLFRSAVDLTSAKEADRPAGTSLRRADMDRIKSRAVDTGSWNWEAEKAKLDAAAAGDLGGSFKANATPVAPPRFSSRVAMSSAPPRAEPATYSNGADSGAQQRPFTPRDVPLSGSQSQAQPSREKPAGTSSGSGRREQLCDVCAKPMTGQFVRALGVVFHLDCFRCRVSG